MKMKGPGQGMTSSRVMTSGYVTHSAIFLFCFNKRQGTIKCSDVFRKFAFLFICGCLSSYHKSVEEGLNLVGDEELFIEAPFTLTQKLLYPETFLSVYESFRVHTNQFHIEFDRLH